MSAWLSANFVNIALILAITLLVALLLRGMIRDRKAGKRSCGGNCASCGACAGCSACNPCAAMKRTRTPKKSSGR